MKTLLHYLVAFVFSGSLAVSAFAQLGVVSVDYKVSIIDLKRAEVIHEVIDEKVGVVTRGVRITPDNALAIVCSVAGDRRDLVFIDLKAEPPVIVDRLNLLEVVGSPNDLAITPDGRFALVMNGGSPPFSLISVDIAARKIVDVIWEEYLTPGFIQITPDGRRAITYSGSQIGFRVYLITAEGQLIDTGQRLRKVIADQMAMTPNGRRLLTVSPEALVQVFSISEEGMLELVQSLPLFGQRAIVGIALTPDGRRAYLADWLQSNVRVLSIDEEDWVEDTGLQIPVPYGTPSGINALPGLDITSDGKWIYLCSTESRGVVSILDVENDRVLPEVIFIGGRPVAIALQK